jgi:hypothetical protein
LECENGKQYKRCQSARNAFRDFGPNGYDQDRQQPESLGVLVDRGNVLDENPPLVHEFTGTLSMLTHEFLYWEENMTLLYAGEPHDNG